MTIDKKILYASSVAIVLALLGALFIPRNSVRAITALILAVLAIAVFFLVKKRAILSIDKKEVLLIMLAMGAVCLVLYYLTGVHFGFYKSSTPLSMGNFLKYILPITIIIISIEVIRSILLAQRNKAADILAYIACILADVLIASGFAGRFSFNRFMDMVGLTVLPAVTANLLYHYISRRYGIWPNVSFRLITTLYTYVLPIYPSTPDAIFAFAKLIVPLAIYLFISSLYEKKKRYATEINRGKWRHAVTAVLLVFMISIVMLISCQFRYGALVIATDSMTGAINKGDAIIYEEYDDHIVKEGDVVVFLKNDKRIVHRVVEIQRIDGRNRYFTQGDANDERDLGYITDGEIVGVVLFKVSYLGYPSIWIRSVFK